MQSFDFKKYLPDLLIIAGFIVLSALFCYPALQGKVLQQHDVVSGIAMSHEAKTYHERTGETTLWSNSMFGGMPTYTYFMSGGHNFIYYIFNVLGLVGHPASMFFLALLSFFILMNVLKVNRWLAAIGAIAFAFASYNPVIIGAGHETKMWEIALMPAVLAGIILLYRGKWLAGSALFGFSFSLIVALGHYQSTYYMLIILLFAVIGFFVIAIREKKLKEFFISSAIALVMGLVAVGPSAQGLLPTVEFSAETMRGGQSELTAVHDKGKTSGGLDKDYAFRWSNSIGETFCIMVPYLYGGSSNETLDHAPKSAELVGEQASALPLYWGPQPMLSGPVYFGAIICFLFVLSLMVIKSPHKWWITAVCALAIIMSWGDHFAAFNYFLFDHLPGLNKFRTPSMVLEIPQFLFPVMGVWALHDIITKKIDGPTTWKYVKLAAGITAGICVLLAIGGSSFFSFTNPEDARYPEQLVKALKEDRANLAQKSALTSAAYILLAAGLLWAFAKDKIKANMLMIGIGILVCIDIFSVATNYLREDNYTDPVDYEAMFQPRQVDQAIMKDTDPYYRVLDLTKDTYNDAIQAYFHKCIGGYNAAKLEIYQDLIDRQMSQATGKFNMQVLNMLNTKYIIFPTGNNQQPGVQQNAEACGNAWFVNEVKWANTADEEMAGLNANMLGDTVTTANNFEPKKTAVIRTTFKDQLNGYTFGKDSAAYVKLDKYGLNHISFTSSNSQDGLAVFSDIYYPHGWTAYVDGKETPIIRANYVLRAIKLPKGAHKIEFDFHPTSFYTGDKIAIVSSLLLYGLVLAAIFAAFKGRKENEQAA